MPFAQAQQMWPLHLLHSENWGALSRCLLNSTTVHRRVKCCSLPFPPLISISSCHPGIQTCNLPVPASHVLTPQARLELKSCSSESSEVIFCLFAEAETLTKSSHHCRCALCDYACESLRDKCDIIKCFVFSDHQFKPLADLSQGRAPILIFKDNNVCFKSDLHNWSIHYIDWSQCKNNGKTLTITCEIFFILPFLVLCDLMCSFTFEDFFF